MHKPVKNGILVASIFLLVTGAAAIFVGVTILFRTEMIGGSLEPITKLLSSGSGVGTNVWKLYLHMSIWYLLLGIATSVIGIVGCVAIVNDNRRCFIVHLVVLTALLFTVVTALAIVVSVNIEAENKDILKSNLINNYQGEFSLDESSISWNYIFVEFGCCGADAYTEFNNAVQWVRHTTSSGGVNRTEIVPQTCCKTTANSTSPVIENCPYLPQHNNSYIGQGCYEKISEYLGYYRSMLCIAGGVALFCVLVTLALDVIASLDMKAKRQFAYKVTT